MSQAPDEPTPPDPTAGLSDPRHVPGPDLFEPAGDSGPGVNPAPEAEPEGRSADDDPDAGTRGLVDPRSEVPGPDAA